MPGSKGASGLKASQLDTRQIQSEKQGAASSPEVGHLTAESQSKNEVQFMMCDKNIAI